MFSLMAAGMGRRVVAVDAMEENLAYIHKSLQVRAGHSPHSRVYTVESIPHLFRAKVLSGGGSVINRGYLV